MANLPVEPSYTHHEGYATRTNIVLDDALVAAAMRATGARTKREVVDLALRELVARHEQRKLKGLRGRPLIDPDYDVRRVRRNMRRGVG